VHGQSTQPPASASTDRGISPHSQDAARGHAPAGDAPLDLPLPRQRAEHSTPATGSPRTQPTLATRPADPSTVGTIPVTTGTEPSAVGPPVALLTAEQAGQLLAVPGSWLREKAAAREIPSRKLGKHLRFALADLAAITAMAARPAHPTTTGTPHAPRSGRARAPRIPADEDP
jgi:hypothetical protein